MKTQRQKIETMKSDREMVRELFRVMPVTMILGIVAEHANDQARTLAAIFNDASEAWKKVAAAIERIQDSCAVTTISSH